MSKASVFVNVNKFFDNFKDSSIVHYGIYYDHKEFYDTGPRPYPQTLD